MQAGAQKNQWLVAALSLLVCCELGRLATGAEPLIWAARGAFLSVCLVAFPRSGLRERALLGLCAGLGCILIWQDAGLQGLGPALDLGAFFGTFILLLTVMKETVERSSSVLSVGHYLTSQPAGRRFFATALGGHVLGVFLNFGAISLMAPLIQKSAVNADGTPNADLERRQLSALIRGFSWVLLWAPTTLTQAVLLTLFPEVRWSDLVWLGLASAAVMVVTGRLYDRWEWRDARSLPRGSRQVFPARAFWIVLGVCAVLIALTFAGRGVTGVSIAASLMFVAPAITLIWFLIQTPRAHDLASLVARLRAFGPILQGAAPALARSAMALGLSGCAGRLAAQVLPTDTLAAALDLAAIPGWLFLAILPILITLGGQIALSPILLVVFLGEVLRAVPSLPAEPAHILFALSAGWALSMTASPNATATLLISATSNVPPTVLTWRWNLRYGLLCYLIFVGIFALIA